MCSRSQRGIVVCELVPGSEVFKDSGIGAFSVIESRGVNEVDCISEILEFDDFDCLGT